MTQEQKKLILGALNSYRGDNYERAKMAFKNKTEAQMQEQYGYSGNTCQEILDGYKTHVDKVEECIQLVEGWK